MKVLLVNGSGHAKGCTYTALEEVAGALEKNGIETEIIQVGVEPIAGCIGCGACLKTGKCFREDGVNEFVEKATAPARKITPLCRMWSNAPQVSPLFPLRRQPGCSDTVPAARRDR